MPKSTAAPTSRTTSSLRNEDDTNSENNSCIERVVIHNFDPGTSVDDLQCALEGDCEITSLIQVYQLTSRGLQDSISFAVHLRNTDEANKLIGKFNGLECDGRQLRAERVPSSPRTSSDGSDVQSSDTTSAGSRKAAARVASPKITPEASLPPRPSGGGNAGSSTGHVNNLTRIDGKDHRKQVDTEQSTRANGNSRRGRDNLNIRGRKGRGRRFRRPYSRGAVGARPDFLELRPRTPLLILAPPTKRSLTGDNDENNRNPPVGINGGFHRQDETVVNGPSKPVVSASTPPRAKEKLTLEERITQALSDFEKSSLRDPVSAAIQGDIGCEMQGSAIPVKNTLEAMEQGQSSASNTNESAIISSVQGPTNTVMQGGKKRETQDSAIPTEITAGSVRKARSSRNDTKDSARGTDQETPGFVPGPAASSSRVQRRKPTLKAEARPFSPSTTRASRAERRIDTTKDKPSAVPGTERRTGRMRLPNPTELYSWVTPSAGAYPDSSALYEPVSRPFYGPVGYSNQHIGFERERSPSSESIQTPGVAAAQATSALRATAGSFVPPATAHLKHKDSTPSLLAENQINGRNHSLAVSLRPAASAFSPSRSYTNYRATAPCNPLAEPFTPSTAINRNTGLQSLRPFPAYFPLEFVNLLSQAGFYSVEDARRTLRNMNIVFKSVEGLVELAPDVLHCFVLEFSMASKLCNLLDFPPFNSATSATRQPPLEMAELTSVSIYCDTMCLEVLQWAGLHFVQEAEELLNIPESVPIFVEMLAQRRPDAFTTFRDTFDLRIRLDEMLGYA